MYIKNGRGGEWWPIAKKQNQIHCGWKRLPPESITQGDISEIQKLYWRLYPKRTNKGRTADLNALISLLDRPSQHIWVTIQDGYLWWCTVHDRAQSNKRDDPSRGHFWLSCNRRWSNRSINGKLLSTEDLPGTVTKVAGFKATVCKPNAWKEILRIIKDQVDPKALKVQRTRSAYEEAIKALIQDLNPYDFEHLIDLILNRSGWERLSKRGSIQEGIDLGVENRAIGEHAFVQVKSEAGQAVFQKYCERFKRNRQRYKRMIFAVHTLRGEIRPPANPAIQIWTSGKIAELVVRLGLGERVEQMRA